MDENRRFYVNDRVYIAKYLSLESLLSLVLSQVNLYVNLVLIENVSCWYPRLTADIPFRNPVDILRWVSEVGLQFKQVDLL